MKIRLFLFTAVCVLSISCNNGDVLLSWGDTSVRYDQDVRPEQLCDKAFEYPAWRGEKISAEAVLFSDVDLADVSVKMTDLRFEGGRIPAECTSVRFIRSVWADEMIEGYDQCGPRVRSEHDSLMVADMIDIAMKSDVPAGTCQPLWVSVKVPAGTPAGLYEGKLVVRTGWLSRQTLPVELMVTDNILPEPAEWNFHLDLWQNPYSVARYHGVDLWSEKHFEYMRPVMQLLASAGQKTITTTIMDRPWNGQTQDPFGPMVVKTRKKDGAWEYDYSVFDRWVEFMMSLGIDSQIACYSMIPWHLEFDYYDEALGRTVYMKAETGSNDFKLYWGSFLSDFAAHLRERGWFEKTVISMDERPLESMRDVLDLIRSVEPDFKVALAGRWHPEIEEELYNYCVAFRANMPEDVRNRRRENGKLSSYYTCCAERYPNIFTTSPLTEAVWIPWHAMARDYDGYLRWAYNSWTSDPMSDTRFRRWTSGDCYCVYPEGRSSLRFEKLIEGIQDYEKASILRQRWQKEGNVSRMDELESVLSRFTYEEISREGAETALSEAKCFLALHSMGK